MVCYMNQFQTVCKCTLLFVYLFPTLSKTSAFYFLTLVLGVCEMGKIRGLYGFLFYVNTSFICYN